MASEIGDIDEPVKEEQKAEFKPSTPKQPPQPQRETAASETERKTASSPSSTETASPGKSGGGSGGKWIFGIIGVIFVFLLINNGWQGNKKPSYNPPTSSQGVNYPQNIPVPTVATSQNRPTYRQTLEAQKLLQSLDYNPGPIDGKFGSRTATAVKAFQKNMGLIPDGVVDQNLINSLKKAKVLNPHQGTGTNNIYSDQKKLAQEIENGKKQAKKLETQIRNMDNRLEDYERRMKSYRASGMTDEYNLLVSNFKALLNKRNGLYKEYSSLITEINTKVNRYNSIYGRK